MEKPFRITDPLIREPKAPKSIDWSLCMLCQTGSSGELTCPARNKNKLGSNGYAVIAELILGFQELGKLPMDVNVSSLNDGSGIESTIRKNMASWHKTCYMKFKRTELERARERKTAEALAGPTTPVKTRRMSEPEKSDTCIFCDGLATRSMPLHQAETNEIDSRVRDGANLLRDKSIMKKLALWPMNALESKYHKKCLTHFYNRVRKLQNEKEGVTHSGDAVHQLEGIALAEVVAFICEEHDHATENRPVFLMSDLRKMYESRLQELGLSSQPHSTRLRERILELCPSLEAWGKQGRDWKLAFKSDIASAIDSSCRDFDEEAYTLVKAAKVVREDVFKHECSTESKHILQSNQRDSVPHSLYTLVSMILLGPSVTKEVAESSNRNQAILSISQLLMFNALQKKPKSNAATTSKNKRDVPLTTYLSMKVHCETRKRELVDTLHTLGLGISYDHLRSISTDIANELCSIYQREKVVCPPNLKKSLFMTACVDNIDHNPSSNTAEGSLHGTAISLMQHPTFCDEGVARIMVRPENYEKCRKMAALPSSYATVPACFLSLRDFDGTSEEQAVTLPISEPSISTLEEMWLEQSLCGARRLNWAAYHASHHRLEERPNTIMAMLPIFTESSTSPAMMLHTMNIVKQNVHFLNPGQTPVIVGDQPLYALMKQIQFSCPDTHGENYFVIMMGALHIEQAAFRMAGNWLDGSGWMEAIAQAEITTQAKAEAALKVSHIKKARHLHEVTAAALYTLQKKAYDDYSDNAECEELPFSDWREKMRDEQPLFRFWDIVLKIECDILTFIRSIREANFDLYIESLIRLVPWFFVLNHVNYARWLSVHIKEMILLEERHPDVAAQFRSGSFVARKTSRSFSAIGLDHAHEQLNAVLKHDGGIIGLTENPDALRRMMVGGPEISALIRTFEENMIQKVPDFRHHEETAAYHNKFMKHVDALVSTIQFVGNPFSVVTGDLFRINDRVAVSASVSKTVMNIERQGQEQFSLFMEERLIKCTKKLMDPIKCNKFPTFKRPHDSALPKTTAQKISLKSDCALFGRLYVACQEREGDLEEFFRHENQACPPSLTAYGQKRTCTKSDLMKSLKEHMPDDVPSTLPPCDAMIFDGPALVHMFKPGDSNTFQEYADKKIVSFLKTQLEAVKRIDVVWDVYIENSLKKVTREARGKGIRVHAELNTPLPKKSRWEQYLKLEENKAELFSLISRRIACMVVPDRKEVYSTVGEEVLCSSERADLGNIVPCNHEEADSRLLLHAADAAKRGARHIMLRASDTDVVVIAISMFNDISVDTLWVAFGTGKNFRYVPVHEIAASIGPEKSRALIGFHSFTGCDTISSFSGRGKLKAWEAWSAFPGATESFTALSNGKVDEALPGLEKFVIVLYDRSSSEVSVDKVRKILFSQKKRTMDTLPPTQDALKQHIKRAAYQAMVWNQSIKPLQVVHDPSDWGWTKGTEGWEPIWTTIPLCTQSQQLISCNCLKGCGARCKCVVQGLRCTALCACDGDCRDNLIS